MSASFTILDARLGTVKQGKRVSQPALFDGFV
ncbi:MAG: hypothetical protein FD153_2025 [Rhodospirillaceae bacterium]|nr:MAG: hypothetical protein FD153_2025 [Rhodospirillaceae bacterium]